MGGKGLYSNTRYKQNTKSTKKKDFESWAGLERERNDIVGNQTEKVAVQRCRLDCAQQRTAGVSEGKLERATCTKIFKQSAPSATKPAYFLEESGMLYIYCKYIYTCNKEYINNTYNIQKTVLCRASLLQERPRVEDIVWPQVWCRYLSCVL